MSSLSKKYDVCVIGSGAGGAPLAWSLAKRGLSVVLLERGKRYSPRDIPKDEYAVCRKPLFRPSRTEGLREIHYGSASSLNANYLWTATCVGGATRVMSGFFLPMNEEDFAPRSRFGSVPEASHQGWPITYNDLAPYYDQVEAALGMSGNALRTPHQEKEFSCPALEAHPCSQLIDRSCKELGYSPFPTPRAVLSVDWPEKDRGKCSYSGFCGSYGCLTGAKGSTHETYIPWAEKTGNLTLLQQHYVYRLESQGTKVTAASCFDKDGVPIRIKARLFVCAASTIESARLLLNSHSTTFAQGLANRSGQVGKNLSFTIPCEVTGYFDKDLFPSASQSNSPFVQRTIQDFHTLDNPGLTYARGGSVIFLLPHPNPIQRMISLSYGPNGKRILGKTLKERARRYFSFNHLQSDSFIEFLPNPKTFITLSQNTRDIWGIPSARIAIHHHPQNILASQIMAQKIAGLYQHMGARYAEYNPNLFTAGELQQGTCRFGDDPTTSVLDPNCQSHDVPNLYVTDGSFMPSGLPVPSTFTIMANSLRVADHIYKKGL